MNEVNAISTSEGDKTPPAAGWPDAKREASQTMDLSAAPLAGRRCPTCHGKGWKLWRHAKPRCGRCNGTGKDTGERSGPANSDYPHHHST